ncbi:MAG: hypothetical protein KAX15_01095 [Candidatus Omnitrophica bacterium]|nr:hypothetical protein [Candidatus Omnitrophota bacterium]
MAKFGTFKFGQAKFGTKPINPFPPNLTYKGIPVAVQLRRSIGKKIIYRVQHGRQDKYKYFIPTNPQTVSQQAWRANYTAGNAAALTLSPEEREPYIERAKQKKGWNWHNVFMSDYLWAQSH